MDFSLPVKEERCFLDEKQIECAREFPMSFRLNTKQAKRT